MTTGWWKIRFDVMLDGIEIDFDELPDAEKRRIQKLLAAGAVAGELLVERELATHSSHTDYFSITY